MFTGKKHKVRCMVSQLASSDMDPTDFIGIMIKEA